MIHVLVATYNHERYVRQSLESILNQVLDENFRITVVDDCSTDATVSILDEFSQTYPEIVEVVKCPYNFNLSASHPLIKLLGTVESEFISFCDGDDYWIDPLKLQKQLDLARDNPKVGLVHTNYLILEENSTEKIARRRNFSDNEKAKRVKTAFDLISGNNIKHSTVLIRKEFLNFNFLEGSGAVPAKDWLIYIDVLSKSQSIYLEEATAVHRIHNNGLWNGADSKKQREMKEQVRWFCASQLKEGTLKKAFRQKVVIEAIRKLIADSSAYHVIRPMVTLYRKFVNMSAHERF